MSYLLLSRRASRGLFLYPYESSTWNHRNQDEATTLIGNTYPSDKFHPNTGERQSSMRSLGGGQASDFTSGFGRLVRRMVSLDASDPLHCRHAVLAASSTIELGNRDGATARQCCATHPDLPASGICRLMTHLSICREGHLCLRLPCGV